MTEEQRTEEYIETRVGQEIRGWIGFWDETAGPYYDIFQFYTF